MIRASMKRVRSVLKLGVVLTLTSIGILTADAQVEFQKLSDDRVSINIDGQPFSTAYLGKDVPKPFLAPLRSATGEIVTRHYPMEKVQGESNDHQHHRGLFTGYGEINGLNFWENEFKYESNAPKNFNTAKNGRILLEKIISMKDGKHSGELTVQLLWAEPNGKPVLEETRTYRAYAGEKDLRVLDVDFTLTAKQPAHFADTKEGFFAIRIADSMTEKNGGVMTNSEGAQTEGNVWGKPANWVDYDGSVEGKRLGIAIFDHPSNLRHPERWHARAYGLFAVNPFGLKDFDPNSTQKGGYDMNSGDELRFRYRIVIHPGDLSKKDIEALYQSYTK